MQVRSPSGPPPYHFDDLAIGQEFRTPARTITEADVVLFAGLSGDYNPLHTDEELAQRGPFGRRVAHGLLGLAVAVGLSSRLNLFEGTGLAFLGLEWSFAQPIFLGDTVHVRFSVREKRETKRPDRGIVILETELLNQRGEVAQRGTRTYLLRRCGAGGPRDRGEGTATAERS
jgi:acyl dehydratase